MNSSRIALVGIIAGLLAASCSPVSRQIRDEAVPLPPFETLVDESGRYEGRTVVMGGYILETTVEEDRTVLTLLRVPLEYDDEPAERDKGRGRLIVIEEGYLEPEVYRKGRKLTVAGELLGCSRDPVPKCRIKSRELHLFRQYRRHYPRYYDPFYDPFFHPYPYHYRRPYLFPYYR